MRALLVSCVLLVFAGPGCGEPKRLADFLPPDTDAVHDDPLMGPMDDDARSPTDVDHATARGKLTELADRVRAFQAAQGRLPRGLDELIDGGDMDAGRAIIPDGTWRVPLDPWGTPYAYERLAEGGFALRSLGPDGERATVDDLVEIVPLGAPDLVLEERDK